MNVVVLFFMLACGAVAQAVIPVWTSAAQAKAPVLMAMVVYYGLARDGRTLLWAAIVAGLMQDGLGSVPFGYSSVVFCATGWLVARFKDVVFAHEAFTHMLFGALAGAAHTFLLYLLLNGTDLLYMPFAVAFQKAMGTALLGALLTPFIFMWCAALDRKMGLVEEVDTSWRDLL